MVGGEPGAGPWAEETFVARSSLEAFDALAVDHRAVLLLVVVEGLPYQDAAHALDVPVGTGCRACRPAAPRLARSPGLNPAAPGRGGSEEQTEARRRQHPGLRQRERKERQTGKSGS